MINTAEHHGQIYSVKTTKKIFIPPYTKKVSFVEFEKEPDEDVALQPTSFQNGLLIPNTFCP
jgi:hypothetical protein